MINEICTCNIKRFSWSHQRLDDLRCTAIVEVVPLLIPGTPIKSRFDIPVFTCLFIQFKQRTRETLPPVACSLLDSMLCRTHNGLPNALRNGHDPRLPSLPRCGGRSFTGNPYRFPRRFHGSNDGGGLGGKVIHEG